MSEDGKLSENWERRRIALRAELRWKKIKRDYLVWSPTLRKGVTLDAAELAFLVNFAGGKCAGDHAAKLERGEAGEVSDRRQLETYLKVQKYLALGLLVDETVLPAGEIANLYFCPEYGNDAGGLDQDRFCRRVATIPQDGSLSSLDGIAGKKYADLLETYQDSLARPQLLNSPLQVCRTRTGRLVLLENVELACLAVRFGFGLRVQMLQPADWLSTVVDMPHEFFGTMRGDMPYQSIIFEGCEIIPGRRRDLNERLDKIDPDDLRGKAVLDLGCNIGMNCILASERGARAATGIDLPVLVNTATRINAVYEAPCRFLARDLTHEVVGLDDHDTVLVFALIGHLGSGQGLLKTIRNVNARVVYVESHCDIQEQGDLDGLLSAQVFSSVEFRGYCLDNVARNERTRRLYRCVVNHGS